MEKNQGLLDGGPAAKPSGASKWLISLIAILAAAALLFPFYS